MKPRMGSFGVWGPLWLYGSHTHEAGPARSSAPGRSAAGHEFSGGGERAARFLAGTALNLPSHILDSSLCDWRALSEVSKLAVLSNYSNCAWVVYELKHFYCFEIILFEKVPKDLKPSHTISRNFNSARVSERKRTVRFFQYDSNIIKFEMASKNVLLRWYY